MDDRYRRMRIQQSMSTLRQVENEALKIKQSYDAGVISKELMKQQVHALIESVFKTLANDAGFEPHLDAGGKIKLRPLKNPTSGGE